MKPRSPKRHDKEVVRITVSLPQDAYQQMQRIAEHKRVSTSWVVRDAVDQYLTSDIPLFAKK